MSIHICTYMYVSTGVKDHNTVDNVHIHTVRSTEHPSLSLGALGCPDAKQAFVLHASTAAGSMTSTIPISPYINPVSMTSSMFLSTQVAPLPHIRILPRPLGRCRKSIPIKSSQKSPNSGRCYQTMCVLLSKTLGGGWGLNPRPGMGKPAKTIRSPEIFVSILRNVVVSQAFSMYSVHATHELHRLRIP